LQPNILFGTKTAAGLQANILFGTKTTTGLQPNILFGTKTTAGCSQTFYLAPKRRQVAAKHFIWHQNGGRFAG
jgi:hypothetical protein